MFTQRWPRAVHQGHEMLLQLTTSSDCFACFALFAYHLLFLVLTPPCSSATVALQLTPDVVVCVSLAL